MALTPTPAELIAAATSESDELAAVICFMVPSAATKVSTGGWSGHWVSGPLTVTCAWARRSTVKSRLPSVAPGPAVAVTLVELLVAVWRSTPAGFDVFVARSARAATFVLRACIVEM